MQITLSDEDKNDIAKLVLIHYQNQNISNVIFEGVYVGMKERSKTMIENLVNEKFTRFDAWDEFIAESLKDVSKTQLKEFIGAEVERILKDKPIEQLIEGQVIQQYREKLRKLQEIIADEE